MNGVTPPRGGHGRLRTIAAAIGIAATIAAAAADAAPVSVGQAGWGWGSPQPQGNTLSGLDFSGSRGYAAGAFGTLLRTDDGGATWTGISTGLTVSLVRVRAIDANSVVVGGGCALRRSNDGGLSFNRLPWTASDSSCPSELSSFHFPSAAVGYLLTEDGSVFRTADGGETFSRQTSVPQTSSTGGTRVPTDVHFTSETTGYATTAGPGAIFRTTDSGNSWTQVASGTLVLNAITFATPDVGYAVGGANAVLRTDDGGATWAAADVAGAASSAPLTGIDCADADTCLIAQEGGSLLRTTDGAATVTSITPASQAVQAAAFASPARAVAVGGSGTTVVSDDGGVNWSRVGSSLSGSFGGRLRATSPQLATVGGANGTLARTLDGGQSWSTVGVPTAGAVIDSSFATADVGYALDSSGGAFRTANGGGSWQILDTQTESPAAAILAPGADTVLLAGPRGIRRSTDGGSAFEAVNDPDVRRTPLVGIDQAGSALLAFGKRSLRVSTNTGGSWSRVRLPGRKVRVRDADFATARVGFLLARDGRLLRTTNGGRGWKELDALGTDRATEISFSGRSSGYAIVNAYANSELGYVLHTGDGGLTFEPQLISANGLSEVFDTGATAFAIAPEASFYETTTGGQAGDPTRLEIEQKGGGRGRLARPKLKVKVSGQLSPAEGGEPIVVSIRTIGKRGWDSTVETAASDGGFSSTFRVRRPSLVVAQWAGDDTRAGAGSQTLRVRPPKRGRG